MRRHLMKASGEKLPAWFREHIVCWYSPKRQGATNENMAVNPILTDLSGHGRDMSLYKFSWDENNGVSEDLGLKFYRANYWTAGPYGQTAPFGGMTEFTYIVDRKVTTDLSNSCLLSKNAGGLGFVGESSRDRSNNMRLYCRLDKSDTTWGYTYTSLNNVGKRSISTMTNKRVTIGTSLLPINGGNAYTDTECPLVLGANAANSIISFTGIIYEVLLFDRYLTEQQIDWCIENIINK